MHSYENLSTEKQNPISLKLDQMNPGQIVELFLEEEKSVDEALRLAAKEIEEAIVKFAKAFREGRIFIFGAGTSGRLGVLEAAECPPTFSSDPEKIIAFIAGGKEAVFRAQEGAEDQKDSAIQELQKQNCQKQDLVIAIAASGVTSYAHGALSYGKNVGAQTILITCNPKVVSGDCADLIVGLPVGPEILTGSTRLKAGTATKRALNMITTGAMVLNGKVYRNLMVDLKIASKKLKNRAMRIISQIAQMDQNKAMEFLEQAHGNLKAAIVMARCNLSYEDSLSKLQKANGVLQKIID